MAKTRGLDLPGLEKMALDLPGAASPGAARRSSGGGSGAGRGGGGAGSKSSDATKDTVRTMQQFMSKLNTELQSPEKAKLAFEAVQQAGGGTAPAAYKAQEDISKAAMSWGNTAGRQTFDGIWGPKTKAQLESIKKFIADTKLPGILIQEGTGARPYREMKDDQVKKMAEDNIANLARLFTALHLETPNIPGASGGNLSSFPLDRIKRTLVTADATSPNPWKQGDEGEVRVTVGDVKSFIRFFQFVQELQYTPCKPLEGAQRGRVKVKPKKEEIDVGYADDEMDDIDRYAANRPIFQESFESLAATILDGSLIRLGGGKTESRDTPAPAAEAKPITGDEIIDPWADKKTESTGINYHCFSTLEDILKWFASRARVVLAQVQDLERERNPHPFYPERLTNKQDLGAAQAYLAAIMGLWEQWSRMKGDILKQIQEKGDVNKPVVTLDMIVGGGASGLPTPGAARRPGGGGAGGGGGGVTIPGGGTAREWVLRGPIQRQMPLNWLLREDAFGGANFPGVKKDQLTLASANGQLPTNLDRDEWRGGNWVNIALTNVKGDSNTEKLRGFVRWAGLVRDTLYELYGGWEARYRNQLSREVIAQQSREISMWGDVITSIITRAQYGMSEAVGLYGGGSAGGTGGGGARRRR